MTSTRRWAGFVLVAILWTGCSEAGAGFFDRVPFLRNWSTKNRVDSLIITGNYAKSRLLAEVAQHKTKQPVILISPTVDDSSEVYFMPSNPEAMVVDDDKYVEFVDFLRPRRLIFLGDESYMPPRYVDALRGRYPTVVVASRDWLKNAQALSDLLEWGKLPEVYSGYLAKLEAAVAGRPVKASPAVGGGMQEPLVLPKSVVPEVTIPE